MHFRAHPAKPKPWVDGLSEGGVEGVEGGQCITGDHKEGQRPRWPVQKDSYFAGAGCDGNTGAYPVVKSVVAIFPAEQSPWGLIFA